MVLSWICPMCGLVLSIEERASGGFYGFCSQHGIVGDLRGGWLVLDPACGRAVDAVQQLTFALRATAQPSGGP